MAFENLWYFTDIPTELVDIIEKEAFKNFQSNLDSSKVGGNKIEMTKRNSKNSWIPTSHWIGGLVWHYVERANRENFLYDITCIEGETLQYTQYSKGEYYSWHNDEGTPQFYMPQVIPTSDGLDPSKDKEILFRDYLNKKTECVRKLSVVMQLSDPDDYEGGNLQFLFSNGKTGFAPRKRGTVVVFDSRIQHRVLKVKSGVRRSIVGWVIGPRWK